MQAAEREVVAGLWSIIKLGASLEDTALMMYAHFSACMWANKIENTNEAVERCLDALGRAMDKKIVTPEIIDARADLANAREREREAWNRLQHERARPRAKGGRRTRADDVNAAFTWHRQTQAAVTAAAERVLALEVA